MKPTGRGGGAAPQPRSSAGAGKRRSSARSRSLLWLVLGVAATAVAGYLVAALVLFPAPLLPNEREVERVLGLTEAEARSALERQDLRPLAAQPEPHVSAPAGVVTWQDPPPGVAVPRGAEVSLTVSSGPPQVQVPDVRGFDRGLAEKLLVAAGLRVEREDSVDVKGLPSGTATGTAPAAGARVRFGTGVAIQVTR